MSRTPISPGMSNIRQSQAVDSPKGDLLSKILCRGSRNCPGDRPNQGGAWLRAPSMGVPGCDDLPLLLHVWFGTGLHQVHGLHWSGVPVCCSRGGALGVGLGTSEDKDLDSRVFQAGGLHRPLDSGMSH